MTATKAFAYPPTTEETLRAGQHRLDILYQSLKSVQDRIDVSRRLMEDSRQALRRCGPPAKADRALPGGLD